MNSYELYHYGILGMKWGIRRYQNEDGTLTNAGKRRYLDSHGEVSMRGHRRLVNETIKDAAYLGRTALKISGSNPKSAKYMDRYNKAISFLLKKYDIPIERFTVDDKSKKVVEAYIALENKIDNNRIQVSQNDIAELITGQMYGVKKTFV